MTAAEALSGHVVDYDRKWSERVAAGIICQVCGQRYRGYRWGQDLMVIHCGCPCICHRKERGHA